MSIHRRAARTDANQAAVIEALESIGCLVYVIRQPVDLVIAYQGQWFPAEVKSGDSWKYTQAQMLFESVTRLAKAPFLTLTSPQQAIEAVRQAVDTNPESRS